MGNAASTRRVVYEPLTDAQQIADELMNGAMGALAMGGEQAPWDVYADARRKRNRWLRWIFRNIANLDVGYGRTPPGMPDIEAIALKNLPPPVNATLESRVLQLGEIPRGTLLRFQCMLCGDILYSLIFRGADDLGNLHGDIPLHLIPSLEAHATTHFPIVHGCPVHCEGSLCSMNPRTMEESLSSILDDEEKGNELVRRMHYLALDIAKENGVGHLMNAVMPVPCRWNIETGEWKEDPNSESAQEMQLCKKRAIILREIHQAFVCPDTQRIFHEKWLNVKCWYPRMSIVLKAWIFFQGLWLVPEGTPALSEDAMRHIIMQYMRLVFKEIAADLRITPLVVGTLLSIECLRPTRAEQQYRVMKEHRLFAQWLGIELQKQQMAMQFVNLPSVPAWQRITYPRRS